MLYAIFSFYNKNKYFFNVILNYKYIYNIYIINTDKLKGYTLAIHFHIIWFSVTDGEIIKRNEIIIKENVD